MLGGKRIWELGGRVKKKLGIGGGLRRIRVGIVENSGIYKFKGIVNHSGGVLDNLGGINQNSDGILDD